MSHLNYQKYCESQLENIKNKKVSTKLKVSLLQSFLQVVKENQEMEKNKMKEHLSTSFSENQSNFSTFEREI